MSRSGDGYRLDDGGAVSWTGKVMVGAIIVLFVAVVFVVFLHLYAKWFWRRNSDPNSQSRRRRRFVFNPDHDQAASAARRGLDTSILHSLPVVTFQSADFKEGLECSVCLCELSDGEKARMLPKCNHGFHLECIDMWFQSHSTCPLCRDMIAPKSSAISGEEVPEVEANEGNEGADGQAAESVNFPTNVLFWGTEAQVNTGRARLEEGPSSSSTSSSSSSSTRGAGDGSVKIVIDIPRGVIEGLPAAAAVSPNSGRPVGEELKSPMARLRRLLSRDTRAAVPSSPRGGDIEQGLRGNVQTPKASSGS